MRHKQKSLILTGHVPKWGNGLFFLLTGVFACTTPATEKETEQKRLVLFNQQVLPAIKAQVRQGAVIFRMGTDFTSMVIAGIGGKDTLFSHCGIVSIESDSVFVYHSIGGAYNPASTMKRETLQAFCHPTVSRRIGIIIPRLTPLQIADFVQKAEAFHRMPARFDMSFDLSTDSMLYCSEMVYKCWKFAQPSAHFILPATKSGRVFVPISSLYHSPGSFKRFLIAY